MHLTNELLSSLAFCVCFLLQLFFSREISPVQQGRTLKFPLNKLSVPDGQVQW